jgi:hypothetical protein
LMYHVILTCIVFEYVCPVPCHPPWPWKHKVPGYGTCPERFYIYIIKSRKGPSGLSPFTAHIVFCFEPV